MGESSHSCALHYTAHFPEYAESIPTGETSLALSDAAKKNKICVVGGSFPERDGENIFNTCTVWDSDGKLIGKYRKVKQSHKRNCTNLAHPPVIK